MDKDFETHKDASEYCEKFGIKPAPLKVFDTAYALKRAYDAGRQDASSVTQ